MWSKAISKSLTIKAPIDKIWDVLTDYPNYHQWNTFVPTLETPSEIGTTFYMEVQMKPNRKPIHQKEIFYKNEKYDLAWGVDMWIFLKAYRYQRLHKVDENTTEYETKETFDGLLVPLVMWLYKKDITRGFNEVANGLKRFCEK
jgi:hypothetical protein